MLLVTNIAKYKIMQTLKHWHVGTHLKVLLESYIMNTNMTGFRWYTKIWNPFEIFEPFEKVVGVPGYTEFRGGGGVVQKKESLVQNLGQGVQTPPVGTVQQSLFILA